ncbi:10474_t:CDS:1 [Acaulospora morrowiae]|uniref:10474_t:CDS:1 n=1 Tax=Acaulospora morrowiae TaxID=94023 RepID=A0A9N9FM81_9GLOM|nr:10474_t:CDS:1 [Acaulospora morrowiae]
MTSFSTLLNPIPQYATASLPALAIMGESPVALFSGKFMWLLRCLGSPFTGLFYSFIIGGRKKDRCIYWLSSNKFKLISKDGTKPKEPIESGDNNEFPEQFRPFGFYACEIDKDNATYIDELVNQCTTTISVLERFSAIVSTYFIIVGTLALISQAQGTTNDCKDWPYFPSLLSWTVPATLIRAIYGVVLIKNPDEIVNEHQITITINDENRSYKRFTVVVTAFISIIYPWITLFLIFLKPPIGYGCRSKFVTIICVIWTLNNILAIISHCKGEKNLKCGILHIWFSLCGIVVIILLILLGFLANDNEWWVVLFGESCSTASIGCM